MDNPDLPIGLSVAIAARFARGIKRYEREPRRAASGPRPAVPNTSVDTGWHLALLPDSGIQAGDMGTVLLFYGLDDLSATEIPCRNPWETDAPASTKCLVGRVRGVVELVVGNWDCAAY